MKPDFISPVRACQISSLRGFSLAQASLFPRSYGSLTGYRGPGCLVEHRGDDPRASSLRTKRSSAELMPHGERDHLTLLRRAVAGINRCSLPPDSVSSGHA